MLLWVAEWTCRGQKSGVLVLMGKPTVLSSTYFQRSGMTVRISLMSIRKHSGPSWCPRGLCKSVVLGRKKQNLGSGQLRKTAGHAIRLEEFQDLGVLVMTTKWLKAAKAFLKSIKARAREVLHLSKWLHIKSVRSGRRVHVNKLLWIYRVVNVRVSPVKEKSFTDEAENGCNGDWS